MIIKTLVKIILLSITLSASPVFSYANNNERILVAGATGGTGRIVVQQLVDEGYQVRAMVRDLEKGKRILGDAVALVRADVTQPETLTAALTDIDYVISTIGTAIGAQGNNSPENVDYLGTVALIDAAKAARVQKFILVTSGGTTWWIHPLNWFGDDVLKWKHKAELYLRQSGLTHVIVRPAGGLKDEPGNSKPIRFTQSDGIPSTVSRTDVATVSVKALIFPEADNKTFEIQNKGDGPTADKVDWLNVFRGLSEQSDNF